MSPTETTERPRLRRRYDEEVRAQLKESLGLSNVMEVPTLTKIVLNCGVGRATQQQSLLDGAVKDLRAITGQRPVVTKARKSIATFKLREKMPIASATNPTKTGIVAAETTAARRSSPARTRWNHSATMIANAGSMSAT